MAASIFLLGKSHGQESLAGYSSWGHKGTESLSTCVHTHTHTCAYVCVCSVKQIFAPILQMEVSSLITDKWITHGHRGKDSLRTRIQTQFLLSHVPILVIACYERKSSQVSSGHSSEQKSVSSGISLFQMKISAIKH